MGRGVLGEEVRLAWLVAKHATRTSLARIYASPPYRWRLARGVPDRLVLAPQDLRAADPTRAEELIEGHFVFAGKAIDLGEASPFVVIPPSPAWQEALLGFSWLRHLRAADIERGRATARRLVGQYLRSPVRASREALVPATAARRVLAWLSQAPIILEGADRGYYRAFIRSLTWQARYLVKAGPVARDGMPRILCAIAAAQASLCLADRGGLRRRATRRLVEELGRQVLVDGGHISRNPQAALELLLDLLPLRQSYAARNVPPPAELLGAIDRLMPMLRFYRHVDGAFAAFNGMGYTQSHLIATLLAYDDARGRPVQNAPHAGYQRLDAGDAVVVIDTGLPPAVAVSHEAHAGTLSFEFSADGHRIVVNCGAPGPDRETWRQLARTTAAHSTATIGEASSAVFAPVTGAKRVLDRPIIAGPRKVTVEREDNPDRIVLGASHDGYRPGFGAIHARALTLMAANGALYGSDSFFDPAGGAYRGAAPVVLRFHLHPAVAAEPGAEPGMVDLILPNRRIWTFRADTPTLELEESIHFANPDGPRRSTQIVVAVPPGGTDAATAVSWSIVPRDS